MEAVQARAEASWPVGARLSVSGARGGPCRRARLQEQLGTTGRLPLGTGAPGGAGALVLAGAVGGAADVVRLVPAGGRRRLPMAAVDAAVRAHTKPAPRQATAPGAAAGAGGAGRRRSAGRRWYHEDDHHAPRPPFRASPRASRPSVQRPACYEKGTYVGKCSTPGNHE